MWSLSSYQRLVAGLPRARQWWGSRASRSDVFTPVAGEVVEVNDELAGQPALVNTDAEGKAWFFKIRLANTAELGSLMDRTAYQAFIKDGA